MTRELPAVIDREFHGTGRDAIGGLSSTGAAALDIAGHAPYRFKAAASYSGCPVRSTGSHSFPLFAHQMKVSWAQTIAPTLGVA